VDDPHFDLGYHLRWIRAPRDGSLRALLDLAASLAMQGFDTSRPLWEFVVAEDLAGGRAALIQKLHHAVTDGIGGLLLMQRVYAAREDGDAAGDADAADRSEAAPARRAPSPFALAGELALRRLAEQPAVALGRARGALRAAVHPLRAAREVAADLASLAHTFAPSRSPESPIMRARSTRYRFERLDLPLARLRAAAHAADCRLNDAFLAGLGAGWRRYHELHGAAVETLRATVPISLRDASGASVAGNQLMLARVQVPVAEPDARRRMRLVRERVAAERAQPASRYIDAAAGWIGLLPPPLLDLLVGSLIENVDFIASCVPGPRDRLFVAGAPVEAIYPFGPSSGTAANATLFSYRAGAALTLNADPASVPDPDTLAECMREGFDEVLALAPARGGEAAAAAAD
jgi:WS/DGAT/MGAT family acyltransferase